MRNPSSDQPFAGPISHNQPPPTLIQTQINVPQPDLLLPSGIPDSETFDFEPVFGEEGVPNLLATANQDLAKHDQPFILPPQPVHPNEQAITQHQNQFSNRPPVEANLNQLVEFFDPSSIRVTLADRHSDPNSPTYSVTLFEDLNLYIHHSKKYSLTGNSGRDSIIDIKLCRPAPLLRGLYSLNYNKPSKIQERALPLLLTDPPKNLICQSQSGTGKTAAFVITMLYRLELNPSIRHPQAICIVNTRELALQVSQIVMQMGMHLNGLQVGLCTGGYPVPRLGTQVIVGTPGRILDLCQRRQLILDSIKVLVMDEADEFLKTQNFYQQITTLINQYIHPPTRRYASPQMIMFSATFNDNRVMRFAQQLAPQANLITLETSQVRVDSIIQFALPITNTGIESKCAVLLDLYALLIVGQSIVFVERKETAYAVAQFMNKHDHEVAVLTSNDEFSDRDRTMAQFRNGLVKVLITTNVLSRGIDVPQVNLVINFDMPTMSSGHANLENYIHRVGRTGRFGRAGVAVNFIDGPDSEFVMESICKHYGMPIHQMPPDFEQMEKLLRDVQVL